MHLSRRASVVSNAGCMYDSIASLVRFTRQLQGVWLSSAGGFRKCGVVLLSRKLLIWPLTALSVLIAAFSRFSCRECTKRVPPSGHDKTLAMLLSRRFLQSTRMTYTTYITKKSCTTKKFRTHAPSHSIQLMVSVIDFQNGFTDRVARWPL